jgi:hypothetical protein
LEVGSRNHLSWGIREVKREDRKLHSPGGERERERERMEG